MGDRVILHSDLNGFFASVECIFSPELKKVPMAVGGNPYTRHGIILAKNELAKKFGVVTAETVRSAMNKCPELVIVPPRHREYGKYSRIVNSIYERFTDIIEPFGIDESWLDVTNVRHLFGDGRAIAEAIRKTVKKETGLTVSIGVSFNKIFAKLGSDYKKPDAITEITRENYKDIVYPLPASALLYVGKSATAELKKLNVKTIRDIAEYDKEALIRRMGKAGAVIHDYANGLDGGIVHSFSTEAGAKSVGNGMTFSRNLIGRDDFISGVTILADEVAARMRKHGVKCKTVTLTIKDPGFKSISRQKTLVVPTFTAKTLISTCTEIIDGCWNPQAPIRLLTVTGSNLVACDDIVEQITLFDEIKRADRLRQERLETAIDNIREKFGVKSVRLGGDAKGDLWYE